MLSMFTYEMRQKSKKAYHHGNLRSSLLTAAGSLLAQRGVAHLSLREVAKVLGVSHTAPYRHFHDKTALIEALAIEGFRQLQRACEEAERKHPIRPEQQLIEAGIAYLLFARERPEIIHLMFGGVLSLAQCGDGLKEAAQTSFGTLVRIIENGQRARIYRKAPVMDLTLAAWAMVHGLSMFLSAGPLKSQAVATKQVRKIGKMMADILLEGMLKR